LFEPFALAERGTELQIGDYVAAVGFAGPSPVIAEGTVKALHLHDDAKVIQTDAVFKAGESGGALLNREGKLVGILTFFVDAEGGSFFAVPTRWVEKLVQLADGGRAPESQPDLAFWERPDIERPMFLRALAREYGADWEGLKLIATQWVEQEAQNPEAWIALGKAHHHFKEGNGAVKAFREAIRIDPRHVEGWYSLGRAYSASNEDEGLEDALKNLEALSPTTAKALRDATRPSR
jgi:serine protease Do